MRVIPIEGETVPSDCLAKDTGGPGGGGGGTEALITGTGPSPLEQARALLDAERTARAQACGEEIKAALERHACRMAPRLIFDGGLQTAEVVITAQ